MADVTVCGAPWCPDCKRSKRFLGEQHVPCTWIDIDRDPAAAALVRQRNAGKQRIPTILLGDGSTLTVSKRDSFSPGSRRRSGCSSSILNFRHPRCCGRKCSAIHSSMVRRALEKCAHAIVSLPGCPRFAVRSL